MKKLLVKAATPNQENLVRSIHENVVTICSGPAGAGKTLLSLFVGYNQLDQKIYDKMLISRSMISCGRQFPPVPGHLDEKFGIYVVPYIDYMYKLAGGKTEFDKLRKSEKLDILPIEILRGYTFDNTFMILDEAQLTSPEQLKLFITRAGKNAKIIILGDETQKDLDLYSGLEFAIDHLAGVSGCNYVKLDYSDIQRNKELAHIIKVFDDNNI